MPSWTEAAGAFLQDGGRLPGVAGQRIDPTVRGSRSQHAQQMGGSLCTGAQTRPIHATNPSSQLAGNCRLTTQLTLLSCITTFCCPSRVTYPTASARAQHAMALTARPQVRRWQEAWSGLRDSASWCREQVGAISKLVPRGRGLRP